MTVNDDLGDDLEITSISKRKSAGGCYVRGKVNNHRFTCLIFGSHADNKAWELFNSKISKLFIQRISDRQVVYNFDRGIDIEPADDTTKAIVSFLCEGLADLIYPPQD